MLKTIRSPLSVNYEVTPACDLRCTFCFVESGPELEHPPLEQVKAILDELKRAEVFEVRLFGGEFFTYPHWREVIRYAHQDFFLGFVSNGTHITPEVVEFMASHGMRHGAISLHGPESIHDVTSQVPGSYQDALRGIKSCLDGEFELTILLTITRENVGHIRATVEALKEQGVFNGYASFAVSRLTPYGRAAQDWDNVRLSLKDYLRLFEVLHRIKQEFGIQVGLGDAFPECLAKPEYHYLIEGCWVGTGFGHINHNGNVRGCAVAQGSFGNLLEQSLEEIWQGPELREFRTLNWLPNKCLNCESFCGGGCCASQYGGGRYAPDEFIGGGL